MKNISLRVSVINKYIVVVVVICSLPEQSIPSTTTSTTQLFDVEILWAITPARRHRNTHKLLLRIVRMVYIANKNTHIRIEERIYTTPTLYSLPRIQVKVFPDRTNIHTQIYHTAFPCEFYFYSAYISFTRYMELSCTRNTFRSYFKFIYTEIKMFLLPISFPNTFYHKVLSFFIVCVRASWKQVALGIEFYISVMRAAS